MAGTESVKYFILPTGILKIFLYKNCALTTQYPKPFTVAIGWSSVVRAGCSTAQHSPHHSHCLCDSGWPRSFIAYLVSIYKLLTSASKGSTLKSLCTARTSPVKNSRCTLTFIILTVKVEDIWFLLSVSPSFLYYI